MPTVAFRQHFPGVDADSAFRRATDFERYSEITDSVREVRVVPGVDGSLTSHWAVNFRRGVLRWSERDTVDVRARTIDFTQIEGDLAEFRGRWTVVASADGTDIDFVAYFDLGMPTLAILLEPVAERALEANVRELMAAFARAALAAETSDLYGAA